MKHFSRLLSLIVVTVFAFSSVFAQNAYMTKAQTLGLKSGTPTQVPLLTKDLTSVNTSFVEEGFDVDFLPVDWTQTILNAGYTWIQTNPTDNNFDEIDPTSLFSAMVPWVAEDQDEWLFSPVFNAGGETPLSVDFYAGVSGAWLAGATLICHISDDGGATWTEAWNALDEIDPGADWAWNLVSLDISDFANDDVQIAWQYVGNDGDLAGIDNVFITAGNEFIFEDDMESYAVGAYLAESDETGFWTTWSDAPGTSEDALITDAESASPSNSCIVEGVSDLVLKLGDKTSGHYGISIEYFIPSDFGGYINLQHFEAPGVEWAVEVYFGAATGAGNGYAFAGDPTEIPFDFPHDTWFDIDFDINIDEDLASLYVDDVMVAEWQFSLQAQGDPGTLQLGGVNIYSGAPTGETPMFYFDNVEYIVVDPGVQSPIIDVDPTSMTVFLEEGASTTQSVTISNSGAQDLEFEIVTMYPQSGKAPTMVPTGANTPKNLYQIPELDPNYVGSTSQPTSRDELIHYDTDNTSAIGSANDYEWRVAAMFPASMLAPYIGMEINEVQLYINDPALATKIQIYGMGSFNTPGPGELLLEQEFTSTEMSWNMVSLDTPIAIDGTDLWVGYWVSATGGLFTPGVDAGPANPNGDWMASGPGWSHLSNNPDLDFNWNIRANVTGTPITQWLSASPTSGTLMQDESMEIEVMLDATGLVSDSYSGKLLIRNNDPSNEQVDVTVLLAVTVGVTENGENEYIAVYPNPASTLLNVKSNGTITNVRLINTIGQVVYSNTTATSIDISNLDKGIYFVQIDTNNGTTTQKVLVQ
ncbi:MAG: T9SS type A sorting domain-containing protein [Bacteroidota bacterium]